MTQFSRKYSDNKYDKPEVDARIEMQTIKVLESMGVTGLTADSHTSSRGSQKNQQFAIEANHLKDGGNSKGTAR